MIIIIIIIIIIIKTSFVIAIFHFPYDPHLTATTLGSYCGDDFGDSNFNLM